MIATTRSSTTTVLVTLLAAVTATSLAWWVQQQPSRAASRPRKKPKYYHDVDQDEDTVPLPPHAERDLHKQERRQRLLPLLTMNKPMYDNILMQDPEGNPLATISLKKAKWYCKKDLADWIVRPPKEDATTTEESVPQSILQLRFMPVNRMDPEQSVYNTSTKANHCVVCGAEEHYMRHYVVPFCYRTLFPDAYKTHLSHDVVLTCMECHIRSEQHVQRRKQRLERALRTDPTTAAPHRIDRARMTLAKQALALRKRRTQMPATRIAECEAAVRDFHGLPADAELSDELLQRTAEMEYTSPNPRYIPGATLVVQPLLDAYERDGHDQGLAAFVREWRTFFLQTMQPHYLPKGWSVDNPVHCDKRASHQNRTPAEEAAAATEKLAETPFVVDSENLVGWGLIHE